MPKMSCLAEFFSCFRSRKRDRIRDSKGAKPLISRPFPLHTSNISLLPPARESNFHVPPLPQLPQQAYAVEKGIVYPPHVPDVGGGPASIDYFSDETYAILMKKREESLAASPALYSENCVASWPKFKPEIRESSESSVSRADCEISNDNTSLELLPKIYTGAMSPIRIPSPPLSAPPVPSDLETGRSFPSLLDEYDPSPVKYSTSRGKSGTYREATLSLFTERRNVNREKQRGITETLGSLKPGKLRSRGASPGPSKSEIIHGNVKAYKELNSDEPVAEDDLSEATTRLDPASDLCDEKKIEDSNGNTIGISLRTEENSGPRQEPHTAPNDNVSSPESTINFKSSINLSHLRALVKPSESNLASSESLLSYRLNSSSSRKENFYNPSEIGVLGEPANLLPSVQGYIPSQPTGDSSIYSSERTSTPISAGMGECPMDTSCLAFPSRTPERKAPDQAQNSYQASGNGLRKKISPVPIFYPPAGRTRPLDVGTIRSIYPDRFPHSLQKLRRVTDHEIFEKKLDSNDKAGDSSKDIQAQSRRSSYGAVTTNVGGSSSRPSDAWHPENCIKSGVGALRTTSCGLNPEYFPGIEGPQAASSSKDNGEGISAIPTNQLTATGRLKSSISLGDRLRGHGRYNKDVEARRRASTNNLRNHATPDTENIDENSDMKNKFSGHRLKMVRSLSRLKNKMYPLSGLKYEMNTKSPASTTVYHLSSYKPGGDFEDKDEGSPTLESDLGNEMEEGMKCSKGAGDIPDGILVKETDNGPIELASDGSDSGVPIIEANPESAFTGYEDCVLLPFSLASIETLAEVRSQENLMELSSPERISGRLE